MSKPEIALILLCFVAVVFGDCRIAAGQVSGEGKTPSIWVEEIRLTPSEILSEEEIASIIRPYEGRHLGIGDLSEVVERLNGLYLEKGYVTAKAVLPPQSLEDGVVRIILVEGRVGEVVVEGNRYTQSDFIVERMSLQAGDLVDVAKLESDILYFNGVYDVKLVARLEAGEAFGTTDTILQVVEPDRWNSEISYANSGREETGAGQFALTVVNRGLFGRSDPFTLTLIGGEASSAGSVTYALPLGWAGGRFVISYHKNHLQVVSGDFADINIVGDSAGGSAGWRHPLAAEGANKVFLTVDYRYYKTGTSFLGEKLVDNVVQGMTYGLEFALIDHARSLDIRQAVTLGRSYTGSEANKFMKYHGSLARQWRWKDRYPIAFRLHGQLAGSSLTPASEHFALGGIGTVRGLAPGAGTGENGYAMSLEMRIPVSPALEAFFFVDRGAVFPDPDGAGPATSVGTGVDFTLFNHFSGSLVYGLPLRPGGPDLRQGRLHLRASIGF